jgi:hypothetical protein
VFGPGATPLVFSFFKVIQNDWNDWSARIRKVLKKNGHTKDDMIRAFIRQCITNHGSLENYRVHLKREKHEKEMAQKERALIIDQIFTSQGCPKVIQTLSENECVFFPLVDRVIEDMMWWEQARSYVLQNKPCPTFIYFPRNCDVVLSMATVKSSQCALCGEICDKIQFHPIAQNGRGIKLCKTCAHELSHTTFVIIE